jgi:hypothetical protein
VGHWGRRYLGLMHGGHSAELRPSQPTRELWTKMKQFKSLTFPSPALVSRCVRATSSKMRLIWFDPSCVRIDIRAYLRTFAEDLE